MSRIYVISKKTQFGKQPIDYRLLNKWFGDKDQARAFLQKTADEEFGSDFYDVVCDAGTEPERRWSDNYEMLTYYIGGSRCSIEYGILALREYNEYAERMREQELARLDYESIV